MELPQHDRDRPRRRKGPWPPAVPTVAEDGNGRLRLAPPWSGRQRASSGGVAGRARPCWSVDHPAPLLEDRQHGDEVERGVRHHVHAEAPRPVGDRRPGRPRTGPARPAGPIRRGPGRTAAPSTMTAKTTPRAPGRRWPDPTGRIEASQRLEEEPTEEQLLHEGDDNHRCQRPRRRSRLRAHRRSASAPGALKLWMSCWKGAVEQRDDDTARRRRWRCPRGRSSGSAPRGRPGSGGYPASGWPTRAPRRIRPTVRRRVEMTYHSGGTAALAIAVIWVAFFPAIVAGHVSEDERRRSARPGSREGRRGASAKPPTSSWVEHRGGRERGPRHRQFRGE